MVVGVLQGLLVGQGDVDHAGRQNRRDHDYRRESGTRKDRESHQGSIVGERVGNPSMVC